MSVNFRLSYNEGFDYTDLFPKTDIQFIENNENFLSYSELEIDIPPFSGVTQTLPITVTKQQSEAPFYVMLMTSGADAIRDYSTITQAQVTPSSLVITRLYGYPKGQIKVKLLFKESGV